MNRRALVADPTSPPVSSEVSALDRLRRRAAGQLDAGGRSRSSDVRVVSVGITNIRRTIPSMLKYSRELLSVGIRADGDSLMSNHQATVALRSYGLEMVSLFDYDSAADRARTLLATLTGSPYYFCRGQLQMKIIDRRVVLLEGPPIDGQRSLLAVSNPETVIAARRYWQSVRPTAVAAADTVRGVDGLGLTARQQEIAGLMTADLSDAAIGRLMGLSVRTVRTEIAAILRVLQVGSRFSAGLRLGQHAFSAYPSGFSDADRSDPAP